jgi:acyl-coenzyme A synthetase/AMP-(fatty) acid ligase
MAEPLHLLLKKGRPAHQTVALRSGQPLDFAAFSARVAAWHSAFSSTNGKRWALYLEDSAEFAAALFGAWHAGKCVYLPSDALPATVERLRSEVYGFVGDFPGIAPLSAAATASVPDWQALDADFTGLVVYTSGSSGDPVAIPKRLAQLFAEAEMQAALWRGQLDGAQILATVSHQHIYGLLFRVLIPLAAGAPFEAIRLTYPEQVAERVARADSVLIASPAHLKRLPENLPWQATRPHLRAVFSSGGPLPEEALQDCRRLLGCAPIEIYGSSETGGIAHRQRDTDDATRWQLLPHVELRIADGVAQVRSPHLPDDDWFNLADKLELHDNGFSLLGRQDRLVKIEEKRVSLSGIERLLAASPLVAEARALLLPDERNPAVVALLTEAGWAVYRESGKRALNQSLRDGLRDELEPSVLPRRWRYVWALPQDAQGKTSERALATLFDPRRPSACLLARTQESASLQLEISADLPYFAGHFPQAPILPGVTQIDWALHFGRELFNLPPEFLRMEVIKFQQVIQPGSSVMLDLAFQPERGCLGFKLTSPAGNHASGKLYFGSTA